MTFLAIWTFLKGIAKAVPLWVWLILAIGVAFFVYGEVRDNRGYERGSSERQALWDAAATAAAQEARKTEDGWRKGISEYAYNAELARIKREQSLQADLDGLRTGAISVRPRFRCPVPTTAGATPGYAGPAPGPGQPSGLQESDIGVVLRIGADADDVSARLAQCLNYVKTVSGS